MMAASAQGRGRCSGADHRARRSFNSAFLRGFLPSQAIAGLLLCGIAAIIPSMSSAQQTAPQQNSAPAGNTAQSTNSLCDAECIRINSDKAARVCAKDIEAQAPVDFEWISRPFGGIFAEADPPKDGSSVVRYRGDAIRFLSPQKEWVRVTYECGFDTVKQAVHQINVRLGRLNAPPPAPQAAPQGANAPPSPAPGDAQSGQQPPSRQPPNAAAAPSRPKVKPGEPSPIEILQARPRSGQLAQ
jgi:hypothetical protein